MLHRFLSIQIILILSLSVVANYNVPDLNEANWDTVLFLTPIGIVKNLFKKHETVMWSFYGDISPGQTPLSSSQMVLLILIYFGMALNVGYFFKRNFK